MMILDETYVQRQANYLWAHLGMNHAAARTSIVCNLLRGVEPTEDLWERIIDQVSQDPLGFIEIANKE